MIRRILLTIACLVAVVAALVACQRTGGDTVAADGLPATLDFNEHVQPILSEYCYQCHGPDPGGRKAKLRLDRADDAFAKREHGPAIVPGQPDRSPVIERILTKNPKQVMPPPEFHKTMKPAEIAILKRWIKEGAPYKEHWAFIPPVRPALPSPSNATWSATPVDRFVLARLERERLAPSTDADRHTLIRRVTLDLTGLLPTPEEVAAFAADSDTNAYEKVVDRLLASPRYGEHRARYWLDYVRYADTHGIHFDNYRSIWPYRDYVVRAYNENKRFDQFVREQLAGDLLPPTNLDQVVATGYLRCNQTSNEGGGVPEEFLVNNTRDRVEAYGSAFLGVTVGCAGCHDHKFDPMTMKDFYRLAAYFNNTAEPAWDLNTSAPAPVVRLPPDDKRVAYDAVLARRASFQALLRATKADAPKRIAAWLSAGNKPKPVDPAGLVLHLKLDEGRGDVLTNAAPGTAVSTVTATTSPLIWAEEWVHWPAMRLDINTKLQIPEVGDFEKDQAFSAGAWLNSRTEPGNGGVRSGAFLSRMESQDKGYRGWDIFYADDTFMVHIISKWQDDALKISAIPKFPRGQWHHVFFTYDGSGKAAGLKLYVNGQPVETKVEADSLKNSIRTTVPFQFGKRNTSDEMRQARYQDVRIYARCLAPDEVARLPDEDIAAGFAALPQAEWTPDQRHTFENFFLTRVDTNPSAWRAEIAKADAELNQLSANGPTSMIAVEKPRQAAAFVLHRGVYSARGARVFPGIPAFLPGSSNAAPDRLALADWTLSASNPLTSRVVVNRMWQELFGQGFVDTADDFGIMGARPSHSDLLDWLAVEFRESGWNVKALYKLLVMSSTYRQDAKLRPELAQRDPGNRLLARGPRHRVDAEVLRDVALQTSGLLVEKPGGASFKGYQPDGLWQAVSMPESDTFRYKQDTGEAIYRRSMYAFWKRFAPPPALETFDAPAREVACPRRPRTNTPLQALALMNEPQFVESYRKLAERLLREATTPEARIDRLTSLVLARPLQQNEREILLKSLGKFAEYYNANPAEAAKILKIGEAPADAALEPSDVAAWTLVASQVLNLDEAVSK